MALPVPLSPSPRVSASLARSAMSKCTPARIRTALSVLAVAACFMPAVAALPHGPALPQITSISHLDEAISVPAAEIQIPITSYLGRIVVDSKEPELRRRQNDEDEDEDEDESSTSTSEEDDERTTSRENGQRSTRSEDDGESEPTRSRSPTSVVTISAPETTPTISPTPSPLPQPFDDSIPSDFRLEGEDNSCPNFMTNLLADPTFQECYPLSMMLTVSQQKSHNGSCGRRFANRATRSPRRHSSELSRIFSASSGFSTRHVVPTLLIAPTTSEKWPATSQPRRIAEPSTKPTTR